MFYKRKKTYNRRYSVFTLFSISARAINVNGGDITLGNNGDLFSRTHPMDNIPFIYDTGTLLGKSEARKFAYDGVYGCAGLDARVTLPVAGDINGQDIYILNEHIGLLVWAGDTSYSSARPLKGNNWQNIFSQWCSHDSQGYSVYVKPVILKRSVSKQFIIPGTNIGEIKLVPRKGSIFTGKTSFTFSINRMIINDTASTCTLQTPSSITVHLPAVSRNSFPASGDEIFAGQANIRLHCESGVTVYATLTDATAPGNRTDMLTLSNSSTARGVGLKIYKNNDSAPVKFGADSPSKGNVNQWLLSTGNEQFPSVLLKARYVNTGEPFIPGTVHALMTYTFSYQ